MFCTGCGNHLDDDDRFCIKCGRDLRPPATAPMAPVPPVQQPVQKPAFTPASPHAPPAAPVAVHIPAAVMPSGERIVHFQKGIRARAPGKGWSLYDVLFTDRRLVAKKSGVMTRLGRGMAMGGAAGLGALGALGAAGVMALGSAITSARVPKLADAAVVDPVEVDGFADEKGYVIFWEQVSSCQMKKGGIFSESTIILQTASGESKAETGWLKELTPIFMELMPGRCFSV